MNKIKNHCYSGVEYETPKDISRHTAAGLLHWLRSDQLKGKLASLTRSKYEGGHTRVYRWQRKGNARVLHLTVSC